MSAPKRRPRGLLSEALTLPNILTLLRILFIPVVLWFLSKETPRTGVFAALVYIGLAITDALDGWLARRSGSTSVLGKFLDPLADKLLVMSTLIWLVYMERLDTGGVVAVILIVARELMINALRTIAISEGVVLAAGRGGKDKTAVQMVAILLLMLHHEYDVQLFFTTVRASLHQVGLGLLYVSLVLAWGSGAAYIVRFFAALERAGGPDASEKNT